MSLNPAFITDARDILDSTLKNGNPFDGHDWSLVQILREYVLMKETEKNNSGYFIIKVHKNTIKGYGYTSDVSGKTTYGVDNNVMKNFCDYHEVFIPNGETYSPEQGTYIPRGDLIIFGKLI